MAAFPALLGLLMAATVTGQVVIEPEVAVRKVNSDLTVICKVNYDIDSCRMTVGGNSYRLRPGEGENEDVTYAGAGINKGECGAHIKNIKEGWNGEVKCLLPPKSGSIEAFATMRLIVAKAPSEPRLFTPPQASFKEGEVFAAQCVAESGRPAANISWLIDNGDGNPVPLLEGIHKPVVTVDPGTDLETISQNVSRTLTADDGGRTLICRVDHAAFTRPFDTKRQLIVNYPPKRTETGSLTIFGLTLNEPGRLNVTVRANPPPRVEWNTAELLLSPPNSAHDGAIMALMPLSLGGGYYNVTLVLSPVTLEAVNRRYNLRVWNELGSEDIDVHVSTMAVPEGPPSSTDVDLEPGAIVGIVVGVLLVLIAVSLAVFAKATHRWCFADRRRDNAKSSGESTPAGAVLLDSGNPLPPRHSDTESAVGGRERSRLAALGARMRAAAAALPRHKDKVQATDAALEPRDEKEPEDKVVYAQLALSEQTTADKPPPPSTEYAEIVYTEQGQKDAKE